MSKNYIDSPNNPPGNQNDYAGDGGDAGKPYGGELPEPSGGTIPFKNLDRIKGDDYRQ